MGKPNPRSHKLWTPSLPKATPEMVFVPVKVASLPLSEATPDTAPLLIVTPDTVLDPERMAPLPVKAVKPVIAAHID